MNFDIGSKKILFVDDESSILSGFRLALGRQFEITCASSGIEALEVYRKEGPFAVIVLDYLMPKMNGAELLMEIRKVDLEVVAILLTGAANFDAAAQAVRTGKIFRLLSKPCNGEELKDNINEAMEHYRTLRSEKDMLAQTMNGAIRAVTSILAASKPLFFGRAQRVKLLSFQIAEQMKVKDAWRLELAITFYYLGFLTLPEEIQESIYRNQELSPAIQRLIEEIPNFTESSLKEIPRLEEVIEIIRRVDFNFGASSEGSEEVRKLASIIRLSKHYDEAASVGNPRPRIFQWLLKNRAIYLPGGLEALSKVRNYADGGPQIQSVPLGDLQQGMRLQEDLRMSNGSLIAPRGSVISDPFLKVLENYQASYEGNPFPERIEVTMGSSFSGCS